MANGVFPLLNVSNVDKSLEFYKALGLKTSRESQPGMNWGNVFSGDAVLILYPKDEIAPNQPADTRAWLTGELGKGVVLSIGVPNATKTYEKAKAFGASIEEELFDAPWGGKEFMVLDPDGYVIGFQDKVPGRARTTARKAKRAPAKAKRATTKGRGKAGARKLRR